MGHGTRKLLLAMSLCLATTVWAAPAHRYFETSDGLRLHYLEAGTADTAIILIPGWLMPAAVFERQIAALADEFRVLAFDPRSQGLSAVSTASHEPAIRLRDLDEFLAAAAVKRFILVGWSLGVLESLDYLARRRPPGLAGVALVDNSIGEGTPPPPRSSGFMKKLTDPKQRVGFLTEFCRNLFRRPPPESMRQAVLASALRVPPAAARQLISQPYPREYWRQIVAELSVPVLYAVTPRLREQAEALRQKKGAAATVVVFDDAGHALFVDEAERFNTILRAFSRQAADGGPPERNADRPT